MKLDRTSVSPPLTADAPGASGPPPARPCFVVATSPHAGLLGAVIDLGADELVVGRDPLSGIWIDDPGVSRRHARLVRREDGGHAIADLGSLNGTFVNGVRVRSAPLSNGDRVQIGTASALRYATHAEADQSDVRLRKAIAAGGIGTWSWDAAGDLLALGPESERLLGLPVGEGLRAWTLLAPGDRERLGRALAEALVRSHPLRVEIRLAPPGRPTRWLLLRGEALVDGSGRTRRMAGALEDVTATRSLEQEVERQTALLESLSEAAVVLDGEGRVVGWNRAASALFGHGATDALGHTPAELLGAGAGPALLEPLLAAARAGERFAAEARLVAQDGRALDVELAGVPFAGSSGEPLGVILLAHRAPGRSEAPP